MSTYIFGVFPLLFWTSCERYTMKKSSENSVRDFVRFLDCLLLPVELEGFTHAYNAYNRVQSRTIAYKLNRQGTTYRCHVQ